MKNVTLSIPESKFKIFIDFVKTLDYVKVINTDKTVLNDLESSLTQVKLMRSGKLPKNQLDNFWMRFQVNLTPDFEAQFKRLAKKHRSLPQDLSLLVTSLESDPEQGIALGHQVYKIRLAITSKGKGKSGGARIITYIIRQEKEVYLVAIDDKGEVDSLSKEHIIELLKRSGLN